MKSTLMTCAGTALALCLSMPVAAQVATDADEFDANAVVVTATKREQTLQEVPIAVTVVPEVTLEQAQIIDVFDLQSVTPSLRISQNQSSQNSTFIIRGFGNGGNNVGIEPSVGVFIDGVYRSRAVSSISDLVDIERVEVIKGPQSTLFGKNASVGVVSVVTREPDFESGGEFAVTLGNFNQRLAQGYVTGPISENVAGSVSFTVNNRDAFVENQFTNIGSDLNDRDRFALRGQLLFDNGGTTSARLIADYDEIEEDCCFAGLVVNGPTGALAQAIGGPNALPNLDLFERETTIDSEIEGFVQNYGLSLQVDHDIGDIATLTSISAIRQRDGFENIDGDFTNLDVLRETFDSTEISTISQELRLAGSTDNFDWLIGGLYLSEQIDTTTSLEVGTDFRTFFEEQINAGQGNPFGTPAFAGVETLLGFPVGTFFAPGQFFDTEFDQNNDFYSVFAQVDYEILDGLILTGGIAYTQDDKEVTLRSENTDVFSNLNLVSAGEPLIAGGALQAQFAELTGLAPTPENIGAFAAANPAAFASLQAGTAAFAAANATDPAINPLLGLAPVQFLPAQVDFPNIVEDGRTSDDEVTFTLRAAYDVTPAINVYASYATGFKGSSFNLTRDSRPLPSDIPALAAAGLLPDVTPVALGTYSGTRFAGPEETEVIEIGAKGRFDIAGGVNFNLALFDQSIDDFQSAIFQGTGFVLSNAGEQSVQGVELELQARPVDWLDLRFAGTLLDPEFDEFIGAPGPDGVPVDLSGTTPAGIPTFSSSVAATIYSPEFSFGQGFVRGDFQYESSVATADNLPDFVPEREVTIFNGSVGFNFNNGVEVLAFARNLFDDEFIIVGFPTTAQAGSFSAYPNAPRTYGATLRYKFGSQR